MEDRRTRGLFTGHLAKSPPQNRNDNSLWLMGKLRPSEMMQCLGPHGQLIQKPGAPLHLLSFSKWRLTRAWWEAIEST